jgi:hypothetical protein
MAAVCTWLRSVVVVVLVGALAAAGCSSEAGDDPLGAFYAAPEPLPDGAPGDVLRSEKIEGLANAGTTWRVLYRSESLTGEPIAVSGVVYVPPGTPPEGGWPVLSLAHGTVGIADGCAPSRAPGAVSTEMAEGFVVVATDYEGLGTAGRHPYLSGESEARGAIDIVRAARSMGAEVNASNRYVVLGFSQGGHAAIFANQIADTWAPELDLVAVAAGSPVAELSPWFDHLVASSLGWVAAMVIAGLEAADPAADPSLVLTPNGVEKLAVVDEGCTTEVAAAFAGSEGDIVANDPTGVAPFGALLDANTPGLAPGSAPLFLASGDADPLIPPALTEVLYGRLCGMGQVVQRETYPGVNHEGIIGASIIDAVAWLRDRLAGTPAGSSCPTA